MHQPQAKYNENKLIKNVKLPNGRKLDYKIKSLNKLIKNCKYTDHKMTN